MPSGGVAVVTQGWADSTGLEAPRPCTFPNSSSSTESARGESPSLQSGVARSRQRKSFAVTRLEHALGAWETFVEGGQVEEALL